jgi:template-activating factor I
MISDEVQQQLEQISKDTYDADRELAIQRNKLMKPIYSKRREILKQVPNFWGTAVSSYKAFSR